MFKIGYKMGCHARLNLYRTLNSYITHTISNWNKQNSFEAKIAQRKVVKWMWQGINTCHPILHANNIPFVIAMKHTHTRWLTWGMKKKQIWISQQKNIRKLTKWMSMWERNFQSVDLTFWLYCGASKKNQHV